MRGWISIHRKLLEKGYANRPAYVSVWVHILLMANHKKREMMWNGGLIVIKPGQFITGRKQISEKSGVPQSTVEDILRLFENTQQIRQEKTNKYRLITILNWDKHQSPDNQPTTSRQQADTNNNVNKENNIAEQSSELFIKEKTMWKQKEEDVIDYDSGEKVISEEDKQKSLNKKHNEIKQILINWLITSQGRDSRRTNRPKQLKALNTLIHMQVSPKEIKQTIIELESEPYWKDRSEKPDFATVVSRIQQRG